MYRTIIVFIALSISSSAFASRCHNPLKSKSLSQAQKNARCVLVQSLDEADISMEQQQKLQQVAKQMLPVAKDLKNEGLSIVKDVYRSLQKDKLDKGEIEDLRKEAIENIDVSSKEIVDLSMEAFDILDATQRRSMLDSIRKSLR